MWALYLRINATQGAAPNDLETPSLTTTTQPPSSEASPETQAPSSDVVKKDPFKEFLEAKGQSAQTPQPKPENSFVPGSDPFKAKLEEQKNTPHSAVSPFKN